MNIINIKVNNEMVDYMERLSYEVEGSKRIIKELITDNADNSSVLEGATFKKYNQRYEEKFAAYEVAKQELQKEYIPKVLIEDKVPLNWNLDFSSGIMTVTILDNSFDTSKLER